MSCFARTIRERSGSNFTPASAVLRRGRAGVALLEVLLALALFVSAAAIITSALNASVASVERQKLHTHAANLATSVLAELQLGIRTPSGGAAQAFEPPFEDWTWELITTPAETEAGDASGLSLVEVVVRHKSSSVVHRLGETLRLDSTGTTNRTQVAPP
jgi:type II secretory pathway pseudopilin PulG